MTRTNAHKTHDNSGARNAAEPVIYFIRMAVDSLPSEFPELDDSGTVDLAQIDFNLRLTPSQRLDQLDNWLRFIRRAQRAFRERHGFDPADPGPTQ